MPLALSKLNLRLLPVQIGILVCFALMTTWLRMPVALFGLANYYNARFSLLVAMLVTIALWFVTGLPGFAGLRRHPLRAWFALVLLALAIWAYMSGAWAYVGATHPHVASNAALAWGIVALFTVVVASAAPPPRVLIGWLIVLITAIAIITIAQAAEQRSLGLRVLGEFTFFAARDGVSVLNAGDLTYVRPYGLYPHPNMLGGLLTVGVLLAANMALGERKVIIQEGREGEDREEHDIAEATRRIAPTYKITPSILFFSSLLNKLLYFSLLLSLSLMLYALLLTFSRAAWIGLAAGAVVLLPHVRLRIGRLLPLLLIALLVGGVFVWQYRPLLAARTGVATESIELRSVADRVVYTDFALRAIEERPVLGQGAGNFPWRAATYIEETFFDLKGDHVHHVFLGVWAELGVVGFALFVLALVLGVEAALPRQASGTGLKAPLRKRENATTGLKTPLPQGEGMGVRVHRHILIPAAIAFAVVGLFDHYPYSQLPFMALWWGLLAASGVPGHGEQQPGKRLAERVEAQ